MTAINWKSGINGDWSDAADWNTSTIPGMADDAAISATGTYTVTILSAEAAHSLTLNSKSATVDDRALFSIGTSLVLSAGTFVLDGGGTLQGGTVTMTTGVFVAAAGTLSGVTFDGALRMTQAGSDLYLAGTDSFTGTAGTGAGTILLTGASSTLYAEDNFTLNNVAVTFGAASTTNTILLDTVNSAAPTLTLGSGASLVQSGTLSSVVLDIYTYVNGPSGTVVNQGTISAAAKGGTFTVYDPNNAGVVVNQGSITVSNGDDFVLQGTLANSSTGMFSLAAGTLFQLSSGATVSGGTIKDASAVLDAQGGTLSNVTYFGTLGMTASSNALYISGTDAFAGSGGTGSGVFNLTGNGAILYAETGTTLSGATLNFGAANAAAYIYLYPTGSVAPTLTLGSTLNLVQSAAGSSVEIDLYSYYGNTGGTLINQGTITASASGGTFTVYNPEGETNFINAGAINVTGTDTFLLEADLTNTSTGVFSIGGGNTFGLSYGISGGTVKDTAGGLVAAGGTLSGLSYLGTLNLNTANSSISLSGLTTFGSITGTGAGVVNLTGSGAQLYALDTATLSNAKLNFGAANTSAYIYLTEDNSLSPTLTLGSTLAVVQSAAGSSVDIDLTNDSYGFGSTLVNQGTITASAKMGNFTISGSTTTSFVNQGLIAVSNGDVFMLETNATNTATGSFTTASAGVFGLSAGYTLSNTGATLSLGSGAQLTLAGTVSGGIVKDAGGGLLSQSGTLNGVGYFGTLNMATAGYKLYLTGNNAFAGAAGTGAAVISLIGSNAALYAEDDTTLSNATLTIGGGGVVDDLYLFTNTVASPTLTLASSFAVVQSAASSTAQIDLYQYVNDAVSAVINQGTITSSGSSDTFNIYGAGSYGSFINQGTINASATKGIFTVSTANFSNQGTINISGTETFSLSTTLVNSSVGTVSIGSGSVLALQGETISGGTIKDIAGGLVSSSGTLSNVTYLGTLSLQGQVTLTGTDGFGAVTGAGAGVINLTGGGAYIFADDDTTLSNAQLNFGAANAYADIYLYNTISSNPTLTLTSTFGVTQAAAGSNVTIDLASEISGSGVVGTLVNQGSITASASGGHFTIYGGLDEGVFINQGLIAVSNHDSFSLQANTTGSALGSFTTASGGIFELDSGYVLSNAGNTLALSSGAQLTLEGTIAGGTITDTGAGLITNGGTLSSVTYQGTLNITGNTDFYITGIDTFAGSGGTGLGVINLTGSNSYLFADDTTTLNNATFNIGNAGFGEQIFLQSVTTTSAILTLGSTLNLVQSVANSNVTIDLSSYISGGGGTLINQGTITAGASGGKFYIANQNLNDGFVNQGLVNVSNGDTFDLQTNLTTSDLGSFTTATGGVVELDSGNTLSNIGATLSLGSGDRLTLYGEITGGIINDNGTGLSATGGTLSGVSYHGTLNETAANASLYVTGASNFAGAGGTGAGIINLTGSNASLLAIDTTTLDNATLNFGGSNSTANIYLYSGSAIPTLTLGSGLNLIQSATDSTVNLDVYSYVGGNGGTLVNQGTITASANGGAFYVYNEVNNGGFINQGVINVSNTDQFVLDISLTTSALGSFTTSSGGVFKLDSSETLSNTGATLSVGSGNQLTLAGTITGGTISDGGTGIVGDGGTLSGLTYQGTLSLTQTNAQLTLAGTDVFVGTGGTGAGIINLTGSGATLYAQDKTTLNNATMNFGAVNAGAYFNLFESSVVPTLTLGSGFDLLQTATGSSDTLDLYSYIGGNGGTVINQGTISANASGGNFYVYGGSVSVFTNQGTLSASNGDTLDVSSVSNFTNLKAGTLTGGSYLVGANGTLVFGIPTPIQVDGANISLTGTNSVLDDDNTSSGVTTTLDASLYSISAGGTLSLASGRNFTAVSHSGSFSDAGVLSLSASSFTATSLAVAASGTLSGHGTLAAVTADSGLISASGGTLVLSKSVSGTGTIGAAAGATLALTTGGTLTEILAGAGTLLLTGATAYSATAVSADTLATLDIAAGATLSATGSFAGGLVDAGLLSVASGTLGVAGALSGAGSIVIAAGATLDLSGGGSFAGNISGGGTLQLDGTAPFVLAAGASVAPGTTVIDAGATLDLNSGGALPAAASGAGTLELSGTTPYSLAGTFTIGTLAIDAAATLAGTGAIHGSVIDSGTLTASSGTLMLAGLSGAGTVNAAAGATLDLTAGGTLSEVFAGAGTLLLAGASPYVLAGQTIGTGNVTVAAGAVLSGNGTVSGAVTDAGSVGAAAGTLLLAGGVVGAGTLSAASGAVLELKAGGTLSEAFAGAGTLRLDGASNILQGASIGIGTVAVSAGASLSGYGTLGALVDSGAVAVTGGTLLVAGAFSGSGGVSVAAGSVLDLAVGGAIGGSAGGLGGLQLYSGTTSLAGGTIATATLLLDPGAAFSGHGSITAAVTNNGILGADTGTLSVFGALGGTGSVSAGAGAVLDLRKGGGTFSGASGAGKLQLDVASYMLSGGSISTASLAVNAGATLTGSGSISAATADAGSIAVGAGTLLISGALTGAGSLSAASGVIDLTAGGSLTETISGGGTLLLGAGAFTLGTQGLAIADVSIAAAAALSSTGTLSGAVQNAGTLSATSGMLTVVGAVGGAGKFVSAGGATLDFAGGGTLAGIASGLGTLKLDGAAGYSLAAASVTDAAVLVDAGVTVSGTGAISSAITNAGTIVASGGTLKLGGPIGGAGRLQAASASILLLTGGGTLTNAVSGAGTLELGNAYVLGATVPGIATIFVNAAGALSGAGTLAAATINNGSISASGGTLKLTAGVSGTGTYAASAGAVLTIAGGGKISGGLSGAGTVDLTFAVNLAATAAISASHVLDTANVVVTAGAKITQAASSTVTLSAAAGVAKTFGGNTGNSYSNAGTFLASGAGTFTESTAKFANAGLVSVSAGTLSFLGAVTNTGTILAGGGVLALTQTLAGVGTLEIGATGIASLGNGAASGQMVDFLAGTGALDLAHAAAFAGTIEGFMGSDSIDLVNTAATGLAYAGGVLSVTNGSAQVASLHFAGSYTLGDFMLGTDGHGGTAITFS